MPTIACHTLGCKVNQYDTQAMLELFLAEGYTQVSIDAAADVYLINTCTVTGTGDRKSLQLARRIQRLHPESKLILCGCLAQKKGADLLSTGASLVIGTQYRSQVVSLLKQVIETGIPYSAVEPVNDHMAYEPLYVTTQSEHTRATLKIQEGCNNHCTYCIIPSVRGPIRSRSLNEICTEATKLSHAGFTEIVLTGIHLSSYGLDLKNGTSLLDVLRLLQQIPGIKRIRLGSLEPTIASPEFVAELKKLDKVCPQFHLALQSGSDSVLRRMKRRYNTEMYIKACENIRSVYPLAALTTDVLTGFPGETEKEFQETCRFIERIGFARIHVFPYSPREDTPAAVMPDQLRRELKEKRTRFLISLGNQVASSYLKQWDGLEADVLLEQLTPSGWEGYTPEYIRVNLPVEPDYANGKIIHVKLSGQNMKGCNS